MKTFTTVKMLVVGSAILASASVMAKECSEVSWKEGVIAEYPQIADACQRVIEMGGREYAELDAKFVRSVGDQVRVKFLHQDGEYGPTYETKNLPSNFQIDIDGKMSSIHRLNRDSTLQLFIPTDRFAIMASPSQEVTMSDSEAYTALPSTASNTGLLGLMGILACVLASGLMIVRRRLNV